MGLGALLPFLPTILTAVGSIFSGSRNRTPQAYTPGSMGIDPNSPLGQYMSTGMMPGSTSQTSSGSNTVQEGWSQTIADSQRTPTYHYGSQGTLETLLADMNTTIGKGGAISPNERMGVATQVGRHAKTLEEGLTQGLMERGLGGSDPLRQLVASTGAREKMKLMGDWETRIPEIERARQLEGQQSVGQLLATLFRGEKTHAESTTRSKSTSRTSGGSSTTRSPQFDPGVLNYIMGPNQGIDWGRLLSGVGANLLPYINTGGGNLSPFADAAANDPIPPAPNNWPYGPP